MVDGQTVAPGLTSTAWHSAGEAQDVTIRGDFGTGPHQVGVTFINDAYGGTPALDRNLYVNSIKFNGVETLTSGAVPMFMAGTFAVQGSFDAPQPPPAAFVPTPAPVLAPAPTAAPVPAALPPTSYGVSGPVGLVPVGLVPVGLVPVGLVPVGLVPVGTPDYPPGSHLLTVGAGKQFTTIATTIGTDGIAYSDSVLTGVLPGSTAIFTEADTTAHRVALNGGTIQAVQGGAGLLTVDVSAGHVVVIGGSGGTAITELNATTGGNSYQTAAGSTNVLTLTGGGTIDSEGYDTITVGSGNSSGQLNGVAQVTEAGTGNITWGVNGTATIQTGPGATFASLGATGSLTLTGTGTFDRVDSNGGALTLDIAQTGQHVSGTATGGSFTTQVYDHKVRLTTAGGSQGVDLAMGDGEIDFISKGADVVHAGSGTTIVQVAGTAKIYAGSGTLSVYGFGSPGADLYGAGGTYELGGDTGNITYHGGSQDSTLLDDLGRGTILGGTGHVTIVGGARDTVVGGTGGITLNMTGGGADDITTVAGSINTLNLTGTNTLASYGQDTIHGDASNTMLSIFGNSTVMLDGGNNSILLAGKDVLTVAAGHDNITLAQGSSVTLALHGNHAVHGQGGTLVLSFTNSAGQISDAPAAGTTEATTDVNGGIHMETRSFGTAISAGAGLFSLDSNGADQVTLGTGAAKLAIWAAGAVVHVGAGTASITGGFVDGAFTVIGGTGLISADSAGMRMTFIGGSGNAVLSGHSLDVFGGTGAISASGVHSFTGSAGSADLVLTGGAKVAFGSGNAHVAEAPWGDADTFTLSPTAVGHAVIDGFRIGTDHLAMAPGMSVASQSVGAGGAHLIFNTGTDLMLTGVQDTKGLLA